MIMKEKKILKEFDVFFNKLVEAFLVSRDLQENMPYQRMKSIQLMY